jgi:uncharacterized FlaG/YvyC family protein
MSDSRQHKKALKDIETYVEHLKNIINEMDKTLSDTNTSLPFSQNNQSRIAGVSGSVRDVSYYNWTNSLRR